MTCRDGRALVPLAPTATRLLLRPVYLRLVVARLERLRFAVVFSIRGQTQGG